MNQFHEIIKIAEIHSKRMRSAMEHIKHVFPMKAETLNTLSEQDLAFLDMFINRFGKLQDLIGSKIINLFFNSQEESIDGLTMLDKLHKLERLGIIEDSELWKNMRRVRNHIAHEYPDNPGIMAEYMNQIVELTPELFTILENIKRRMPRRKDLSSAG